MKKLLIINASPRENGVCAEVLKQIKPYFVDCETKEYNVYKVNAMEEALKLGNSRVFNIIVLGVAAKHMDFSKEAWLEAIEKTVPPKTVEINKKAFLLGYEG